MKINVAKIVGHHGNKRDENSLFVFVAIEIVTFMCYNSYIGIFGGGTFMNKIKTGFIFIFILLFLIMPNKVLAVSSCDYADQVNLSTQAHNIRTNYELKEIATGNQIEADDGSGMEDETYIGVEISVYNVTEDIYVVISDSKGGEPKEYHFEDTDNGTIKLLRGNDGLTDIVTYHVSIRSDISDCYGEEYHSIDIITPMYNYFSSEPLCADSTKYYCQEYITQDLNMSYADFVAQATKDLQKEDGEEQEDNQTNNNNAQIVLYVVIGLITIGIGVTTFVVFRKKQRSSVK